MYKLLIGVFLIALFNELILAQENNQNPIVNVNDVTFCCEKTKSGLACIDAKEEDCNPSFRKLPTACSSSSFCAPGWCFDSVEGTCLDNTPQIICNQKGGTWSAEKPPQCNLGCCVLGNQGSFVTLTRCKKLSSFYGLKTNFNPSIEEEIECINIASGKEKGACVFMKDFEKTCKLTTREDCTSENMYSNGTGGAKQRDQTEKDNTQKEEETERDRNSSRGNGGGITGSVIAQEEQNDRRLREGEVKFFPGYLCSAEELGTNCGPTKQTTCVEGKEEVYFLDSCGNVANIYDARRLNDKAYWKKIIDKKEACNPGSSNENSQTCGNCNYLFGSYCREATDKKPAHGNYICQSLNCRDEKNQIRLHGESWCVFDVQRDFSPRRRISDAERLFREALTNINRGSFIGFNFLSGNDAPVGSKFYRYLCNNGNIIIEPCADFRQEECLENKVQTPRGTFSEAACRVNRWQDCTEQKDRASCENYDKRDCKWLDGIEYVLIGAVSRQENVQQTQKEGAGGQRVVGGSNIDASSLEGIKAGIKQAGGLKNLPRGACVPKTAPGLKFWEGQEAAAICAQANAVCPVVYKKGLIGGDWKCVDDPPRSFCACLEKETELKRAQVCMALGDCGPKVNIEKKGGNTLGYKIIRENSKKKK